jgi:hypothetical protein
MRGDALRFRNGPPGGVFRQTTLHRSACDHGTLLSLPAGWLIRVKGPSICRSRASA